MNDAIIDGFLKEAGLLRGALRLKRTLMGGTKALAVGREAKAARGILGGAPSGGMWSQVKSMGVRSRFGDAPAATKVRNRMLRRGAAGVAIGAGTSMLGDKMRGEDVDVGKAFRRGLLGGAVGGALGTTGGARMLQKATANRSTPNMGFAAAANPAGWLSKSKDVTTKLTGGRSITTAGRSAWGNMSLLDKAFTAQGVYDSGKALVDKEHEGRRMEGFLGGIGSAGAMLTASRWRGMRSARGTGAGTYGRSGTLAHIGKTTALYTLPGMAGSMVGKQIDRATGGPRQEEQSYA